MKLKRCPTERFIYFEALIKVPGWAHIFTHLSYGAETPVLYRLYSECTHSQTQNQRRIFTVSPTSSLIFACSQRTRHILFSKLEFFSHGARARLSFSFRTTTYDCI